MQTKNYKNTHSQQTNYKNTHGKQTNYKNTHGNQTNYKTTHSKQENYKDTHCKKKNDKKENKSQKGLPLETKNTQNHENRRLGLTESIYMQHCSLRGNTLSKQTSYKKQTYQNANYKNTHTKQTIYKRTKGVGKRIIRIIASYLYVTFAKFVTEEWVKFDKIVINKDITFSNYNRRSLSRTPRDSLRDIRTSTYQR